MDAWKRDTGIRKMEQKEITTYINESKDEWDYVDIDLLGEKAKYNCQEILIKSIKEWVPYDLKIEANSSFISCNLSAKKSKSTLLFCTSLFNNPIKIVNWFSRLPIHKFSSFALMMSSILYL